MESRISKQIIILSVWWVITLIVLLLGFLFPLMRIPVMGLVHFHEVHGGSKMASWLVMGTFALGGVALFGRAGLQRVSGLVSVAVSLVILATCLIRLYLYLSEKLRMLSTEGMDLSRVLQKGGICLMSAFISGVIWLAFYGITLKRRNL
ncbi:MAG: hypothetical protein P1U86_09030 [Verrucomicrobiales bacterium]|nr:hypothetical protein [Verrucomicrobiales bacterium]